MRLSHCAGLSLVALLALGTPRAQAQISANVRVGRAVSVNVYSPQRYGEWRTSYREWQPVTLYYMDGRYYRRYVRGAHPVMVYRWNNEYFLPPRDRAWVRSDRRYDYRRRPGDEYYRPRPPGQ